MLSFTRRQWITLTIISIESFIAAACISVEAPFFPKLAMRKSCSLTEIGLVFSLLEFVIFVMSPLIGKYLDKLGIKLIYVAGIYILSIFCVLFGLLNYIPGHSLFIGISLLVRSIEAVGVAFLLTARNAIIAQEYPQHVGAIIAVTDMTMSLGIVFGSSVGGVLNELGGFTIPFAVYGSLLFLVALLTTFMLPSSNTEQNNGSEARYSALSTIKIPSVLITVIATVTATLTFGFLQANLEPFVRQFHLKPTTMGLVFVIPRVIYAITSVLIGRICDKIATVKFVIIIGSIFQVLCFTILGPASFIPMKPSLVLVMVGLVIHGFGLATQSIGTFVDIHRSTLAEGYANDMQTNGLVSGTWNSAFSLGAFIGPTLGGFLVDKIGFRNASIYIAGSQAIIAVVLSVYVICKKAIKYVKLQNEEFVDPDVTTSENGS